VAVLDDTRECPHPTHMLVADHRCCPLAEGRIGCASPPGHLPGGPHTHVKGFPVGSVIKKRRKRMAKKKHRKLLKKTRVQRRKLGK
jgi:hypothetical protein